MSSTANDRMPVSFGWYGVASIGPTINGANEYIEIYKPKQGGEIVIWTPLGLEVTEVTTRRMKRKDSNDQTSEGITGE